jgi:hypothetical protein
METWLIEEQSERNRRVWRAIAGGLRDGRQDRCRLAVTYKKPFFGLQPEWPTKRPHSHAKDGCRKFPPAAKPSHSRAAIQAVELCLVQALNGGTRNMSLIKSREPAELDKPAESEVEGDIREFVRRDVATLRRQPENDSEMVASNISSLLQRVAGTSVQEIDKLIGELQTLREMLATEGARVQREIVEYATLSQAAMQSTKIIAESLTHWKKVPDAPSLRD